MKLNIKCLAPLKPVAYIFMYTCTDVTREDPYYEYSGSILDNAYIFNHHTTKLLPSILNHFNVKFSGGIHELNNANLYSSPKALDNSNLKSCIRTNTIKSMLAIELNTILPDNVVYSLEHISAITILNSFQEIKDYIDDEK